MIGINTDRTTAIEIARGDRIAQLIVQEFSAITWREIDELPGSWRGEGGFGSSGIR
ncbi:MAG: hypothetical protein O2815_09635 [Actinomycetota bacterium]|nr:hypothetical protein [Actinomycetota bacterium]